MRSHQILAVARLRILTSGDWQQSSGPFRVRRVLRLCLEALLLPLQLSLGGQLLELVLDELLYFFSVRLDLPTRRVVPFILLSRVLRRLRALFIAG